MAVENLWTKAPRLRQRARRQSVALRPYLSCERLTGPRCAGWSPEDTARHVNAIAHGVGWHGGRLLALRMEAYDRLHALECTRCREVENVERCPDCGDPFCPTHLGHPRICGEGPHGLCRECALMSWQNRTVDFGSAS